MEEQFTGLEQLAITDAKLAIKKAKERIRMAEDSRRDRLKIRAEAAAKARLAPPKGPKAARDNKIRAALLEMTETAKKFGMKFDAPPKQRANVWSPARYPFTKLHITDVHGNVEIVQIYTRADGFEWD